MRVRQAVFLILVRVSLQETISQHNVSCLLKRVFVCVTTFKYSCGVLKTGAMCFPLDATCVNGRLKVTTWF